MSTQDTWSTGSRLLLALGIGLLLFLAWQGGRMSAGGGGFFGGMGMMDGGRHMGGSHMRGGASEESQNRFEGETGLQRCQAMMGTMEGMHRSMRSMMAKATPTDSTGTEAQKGMMDGQMGRGMAMMQGGMGSRGAMMDAEQMRQLCRTMHEAMQAAMHGKLSSSSGADTEAFDGESLRAETEQWLRSARGIERVEDQTGEDEVLVEVGGGNGLQYAPAAVRVDPGTTVRWRWTGQGGLHDVSFLNADVSTALRGEAGAEFSYTFDAPGEYRYECTPHSGVGMRGAVIVADE